MDTHTHTLVCAAAAVSEWGLVGDFQNTTSHKVLRHPARRIMLAKPSLLLGSFIPLRLGLLSLSQRCKRWKTRRLLLLLLAASAAVTDGPGT